MRLIPPPGRALVFEGRGEHHRGEERRVEEDAGVEAAAECHGSEVGVRGEDRDDQAEEVGIYDGMESIRRTGSIR